MSLEDEMRDLMERTAAPSFDHAKRLDEAANVDINAQVDGLGQSFLTTSQGLEILGRLNALREAVFALAREIEALKAAR